MHLYRLELLRTVSRHGLTEAFLHLYALQTAHQRINLAGINGNRFANGAHARASVHYVHAPARPEDASLSWWTWFVDVADTVVTKDEGERRCRRRCWRRFVSSTTVTLERAASASFGSASIVGGSTERGSSV
jgi:hypothetical protein